MLMDPYYVPIQDEIFHGDMTYWALSPDFQIDLIGSGAIGSELDSSQVEPALAPMVVRQSAFEKYIRPESGSGWMSESGGERNNINKRVIEMVRKMASSYKKGKEEKRGEAELSRGFRHMMRERQRREKLSQSYSDLYSMLSSRSKGDKNSIVQSAALYIRELKGVKEQLQRTNEELKNKILGCDSKIEGVKVKFEVANPTSSIDSMISALNCLKNLNVKAKAIRSDLSSHGLSTVMSIETKMAASDVERAVEGALRDVETNSNPSFHGNYGWAHNSHTENVF